MRLDRRTLIGGLAAALAAPKRSFAAAFIDATGRTITAPNRVARVYPAGPPAAVLIYTLAPELLIGWLEAIGPVQRAFLLPAIAARPQVPRLTARGTAAVDVKPVVALKPDLIVDFGNVGRSFAGLAKDVEQETGIPYVLLDGHFDHIARSYRALGRLTGRAGEAETLARYAEETTATVRRRVEAVSSDARPRVYYARDPSGLRTAGGGSMVVEAIEFAGGRNVAAGHRGQTTVSIAQVQTWNPALIIAGDPEFAAQVRNDPAWAAVAAVKAGRVYAAPRAPFGWVDFPPSVNRLIGLWWLGKIFYPDRFPEDLAKLTRDFYAMFYRVTPTAAQVERLLAGVG